MSETADDPFNAVREDKEAIEALAGRNDRSGAAARVVLALAQDEQPDSDDLETAGFAPLEDETTTAESGEEPI